jgi:hypothetical protein
MNKYSGIDLHSNNCVVAVIDDTDRVCCERRVPNDLAQIVALLAGANGVLSFHANPCATAANTSS